MCWPHPAQVGFPQVWQFTRWHMLAVLLSIDTGFKAQAPRGRKKGPWGGTLPPSNRLSEMQRRPKT